jgi:hypothetical protein
MQQYYYRIRHIETGKIYIGCQYGQRADPAQFFVTYFTSSKTVQQIIMESGKHSFVIEKIIPLRDAQRYERRILVWWYTKLGKTCFMDKFINRNTSPGILIDDETRARLIADPIKNAKIAATVSGNTNVRGKAWWNDGVKMKRSVESPGIEWSRGALKHSEETKKKRSESHLGKPNSALHNINIAIGKKNKIKVVNITGDIKYCDNDSIPYGFFKGN